MKQLITLFTASILCMQSRAVTVQISVLQYPACIYSTGMLMATAQGGVGPYTYAWSNGAFGEMVEGLPAGTYSVTVTDFLGDEATDVVEISANALSGAMPFWVPGCHPPMNPGSSQGSQLFTIGNVAAVGMPPHTTSTGEGAVISTPFFDDVFAFGSNWFESPGTPLQISVTDANGCSFEFETTVPQPRQPLTAQVLQVDGACSGGINGRFRVFVPAEASAWATALEVHGNGSAWNWSTGAAQMTVGNADRDLTTGALPAGTYHVISRVAWDWYGMAQVQEEHWPFLADVCADTIAVVEVPDLGFTCGTLSGRLFVDNNENCTQNGGEPGLPATVVEVQPGNYYALTNATGNFSLNLPYGSYTVADQNPLFQEHCGASTTPFTLSAGTPQVTRNLPDTSLVGLDVQLSMGSGPARPGFELNYGISILNLTGASSGVGTLTVTVDPSLTFISSSPLPTNVSGNVITWSFNSMNAFQQRSFGARFQVPPDIALLGTDLEANAVVSTANTDTDPTNNTASYVVTVTGAYDPNDKLARTSGGNTSQWQINEDEWIDYTIRFQNTGSDTAFFVVITDTLPDNLDPATFRAGVGSHTHNITLQGHGIVRWIFPNILLPDSNINEPRSHGFVTFRIRPRLPLLPGDEIENIANIYFDFNPPVITEPSVLTVPVPSDQVLLDAQLFLSGVYDSGSGLMRDDLRAQGLLPTSEPYSALGYSFQGGGDETASPTVLAQGGPTAIVDWVVVELRSAATPAVVAASRAALLRRDGRVVDLDGVSPVAINAASNSYLVALRHRNHLPVLFDLDLFFPPAENEEATAVDFTDPSSPVFGTNAQRPIGGVMALWPGDVDFNGTVKYTGVNNDRDIVLVAVGGSTPTNVVNGVYSSADVNMDGDVKYTGTGNDRDVILQTIGGVVPTAVRTQQMP